MVIVSVKLNKVLYRDPGSPVFYFEDEGKPSIARLSRIPIRVACTCIVLAVIVESIVTGCTDVKDLDHRSNTEGNSGAEDSYWTQDNSSTIYGRSGSPYSGSGGGTSGGDAGWVDGPGEVDDAGTVGEAGGAGDADGGETIVQAPNCFFEQEGQLRCVTSGSAAREICQDTLWQTTDSCATGEICDTGQPGTCIGISSLCAGSASRNVCTDGVMYTCDGNSISVSQQKCESQALCLAGLSRGTCAACTPLTDFRCNGSVLERCSEAGVVYDFFEQCTDQNMCNANAKACTEDFCLSGQFICRENVLMKCNADQTAWEEVKNCGDATCDEKYSRCNICTPSDTKCTEDGKPAICSSDGQRWDVGTCSDPRSPVCVGQGKCVPCKTAGDCGEASDCNKFDCGADNNCVESPDTALNGSACGVGGQSSCNNGMCVGCIDDTNCRSPRPACTEDNTCVSCLNNNHCGNHFCLISATPSDNECVECRSQNSGDCAGSRVCDEFSHTCVDCLQPSDCDGNNPARWSCQSGNCIEISGCPDNVLDLDEQCDDGSTSIPQRIIDMDGCRGDCMIDTTFGCNVTNATRLYRPLLNAYVWTVPVKDQNFSEGDRATCAFPCNDPDWDASRRDWDRLLNGNNSSPADSNAWIAEIPTDEEIPGTGPEGFRAKCMNGALLIDCKNGQCPLGYKCAINKTGVNIGELLKYLTENQSATIGSFMQSNNSNKTSTKTFCQVDPTHSYWNGYAWP